tara:strand:- start:233 stop:379 length:147 start_codon:yes stop_codon:yes gene_type:complete
MLNKNRLLIVDKGKYKLDVSNENSTLFKKSTPPRLIKWDIKMVINDRG